MKKWEAWIVVRDEGGKIEPDFGWHDRNVGSSVVFLDIDAAHGWIAEQELVPPEELFVMPEKYREKRDV